MKRTTLFIAALLVSFGLVNLGVSNQVAADSSSASAIAGGNTPSPENVPHDKRTDLTGGQQGVPEEYANEAVAEGKLKEVADSKWLNKPVTNMQGEKLGTIAKVIKDDKTQKIEYVILQVSDSQTARPLPWGRFQEKGDKLTLNATKQELMPTVNRKEVKDMSPDLAMFMDDIEQKRSEPKASGGRPSGDPGSLSGAATMGEDQAGTTRSAPPTPAPGFKHEGEKKKQ
ncbi:MAG TPA: PRC-barrel domain-containing protein [Nitrospira sp.]|nr:PRC-barrel domain-containing protein [Nitrospira sp.]